MCSEIIVFDKLESTNTYLLENHKNYPDKTTIVTKEQTNGKGRLGRDWIGKKNHSLAMSILLKKETIEEHFSALPLYMGITAVRALSNLGIDNIGLKWVNDIVYDGKKLGGILVESKILSGEVIYVLGIGINIDIPDDFFIKNKLETGISIYQIKNKKIEMMILASEIKRTFFKNYNEFSKNGLEKFKREYEKYCVNINKTVLASLKNNKVKGKCIGINKKGNLLLETDSEIMEIYSGEASIRGENSYY